ncbi:MAG: ammonium transporter [Xanthomonadaceae bacterium]|nr:ammonium transporter [Xanthomonadaceae bacterium]
MARWRRWGIVGIVAAAGAVSATAWAQTATAETATAEIVHSVWIATCAGLVLMMQPGFALLESGFCRAKNAVNVIMKNFTDCAIASLAYWAVGFGLMFGTSYAGMVGTSDFFPGGDGASLVNVLYQTFFAATAATIISGAVAERIRFVPYLIGSAIMVCVIYPLYGAWIWGGTAEAPGWLRGMGFLDTAGGAAVHTIGGFTALGALVVLGPRFGRFSRTGEVREIPGHNLPLAALGAFLLWVGWLGFNGGAVDPDFKDLGRIVLNTHLGAAAGVLGAMVTLAIHRRPLLMSAVINGALGGLVSITAGAKYIDPAFAVIAGLVGGMICVVGPAVLQRMKIDDVVDAVSVHGFCGLWGTIATGMFMRDRLFDPQQIGIQALGAVVAAAWAFSIGWLLYKLLDMTLGVRASTEHEQRGLDYTEHYEIGYGEFMAARTHRDLGGES